jgi:hypothetical protein
MVLPVCAPLASEFSPLQGVGSVLPVLATEKTLNPPVWSFIEKTVGPVKFTMGYCGLNVLSINLNTHSPSWSYDSRVGLESSYYHCYNNGKPCIVNCIIPYTQSLSLCLITQYCLMERVVAPIRIDAWVCVVVTTC